MPLAGRERVLADSGRLGDFGRLVVALARPEGSSSVSLVSTRFWRAGGSARTSAPKWPDGILSGPYSS